MVLNTRKYQLFFTLALLTHLTNAPAAAATIFSHSGSANPTTEGWSEIGAQIGIGKGPVIDDNGTGLDAWFISDSSTAGNSLLHYTIYPSLAQVTEAAANGWTYSARLRMVEGTTGIYDGMFIDYGDGTTIYLLTFDRASDGDPIVVADGFASYTLEGAGDGSYHQYEMIYDPIASNVDIFVDGVERISNYTGTASTTTRVAWGAAGSNATGQGNYSSVQFSVVPEPSSTAMLIGGIAMLAALRCRQKK